MHADRAIGTNKLLEDEGADKTGDNNPATPTKQTTSKTKVYKQSDAAAAAAGEEGKQEQQDKPTTPRPQTTSASSVRKQGEKAATGEEKQADGGENYSRMTSTSTDQSHSNSRPCLRDLERRRSPSKRSYS